MPTAEGTFPKIGADPLYFSEVNRFAKAGEWYFAGSTGVIASGTATQIMGSLFFGAGSLSNPCWIVGALRADHSAADNIQIKVSGLTGNVTIQAGSGQGADNSFGRFDCLLGSPSFPANVISMETFLSNVNNRNSQDSRFANSSNNLGNFNPASGLVIFFQGNASANMQITHYNVQAFRGTY